MPIQWIQVLRSRSLAAVLAVIAVAGVAFAQAPAHVDAWATLVAKRRVTFASAAAFPASSGAVVDPAANRITINSATARLTVLTGPKENMMAFKIDGLINPEIMVHRGARLTLTVINVDGDMMHNFMLTRQGPPYPAMPAMMGKGMTMGKSMSMTASGSMGSGMLAPHRAKAPYVASRLLIRAAQPAKGYYLCAARGHAKAGMFGRFTVEP